MDRRKEIMEAAMRGIAEYLRTTRGAHLIPFGEVSADFERGKMTVHNQPYTLDIEFTEY